MFTYTHPAAGDLLLVAEQQPTKLIIVCTLCFRHLGSQLAELERAIEKMMEADFVQFALEDILHRLPAVVRKDGLQLPNLDTESSEVS